MTNCEREHATSKAEFCGYCGTMLRQENRERMTWWVVLSDHRVVEAEGLSCAPANPGYWWFPTLGFSASVGHHLFVKQRPALEKALSEVSMKIARLGTTELELLEQLQRASEEHQ